MKIDIIGQEYRNADYIYKNNISEVNAKINKKYEQRILVRFMS